MLIEIAISDLKVGDRIKDEAGHDDLWQVTGITVRADGSHDITLEGMMTNNYQPSERVMVELAQ